MRSNRRAPGPHLVRRRLPGSSRHYLLATEKRVQLNKYWDFDYPKPNQEEAQRSDADYRTEFRDTLEEAVRLRLLLPEGEFLLDPPGSMSSAA